MKIRILGTGCAFVTKCYNTCFSIYDVKKDEYFLADAGGGSQILERFESCNIDYKKIHHIFLTHKHIDHILGMVWVVRLIAQNMAEGRYDDDVTIYGHDEAIEELRKLTCDLLQKKQSDQLEKKLHLKVVNDGESIDAFGHKVTFFDMGSQKTKQFGCRMELEEGKSLVCLGDEPYRPHLEKYAKNATWLLHEAFCQYEERDRFKPYEKSHSTVKEACENAQNLKVQNLIIYHTKDNDIETRKQRYTDEGKAFFKGRLFVPDDLDELIL
ncbi:MAG TPA: MBL fold metallo-hydrolase [Succinivibrionaceae bacterium]|nr:MBL fold metallo-hydrolase [Succinivibrionaceae bacterium]